MFLLQPSFWEIKQTSHKGKGVFAKKVIKKGIVIGDYVGLVLRPQDAIVDEENFYLMYYHDNAVISPDLKSDGVHLLNHSCNSNAFIFIYHGHTLAFALRDILEGEEITINYLLSPKNKFCDPCPHICNCADINCSGTMHLSEEAYKKWRAINLKQSAETKRERIRYGKELPKLKNYPFKVNNEYIKTIEDLLNTN